MSNVTMVFGTDSRRSNKWRVYRIRTANSTYELEVEAATLGRRCVVLTCVAPPERAGLSFEDSAPQVNGENLFALSPVEWMGKCLTVGTARTSELQSVDFVAASEARAVRTQIGLPKQAEPKPHTWAAFPEGPVEMAEAAASLLRATCHARDLQDALRHDRLLAQRLKSALEQCKVLLEVLGNRPVTG